MYKKNLALNDLQRLICHKTKPNQTLMYIKKFKRLLAWVWQFTKLSA